MASISYAATKVVLIRSDHELFLQNADAQIGTRQLRTDLTGKAETIRLISTREASKVSAFSSEHGIGVVLSCKMVY